jgi:hypothetical protein
MISSSNCSLKYSSPFKPPSNTNNILLKEKDKHEPHPKFISRPPKNRYFPNIEKSLGLQISGVKNGNGSGDGKTVVDEDEEGVDDGMTKRALEKVNEKPHIKKIKMFK